MSADSGGGETTRLPPDDAFRLLGNETRIGILLALWEASEPGEDDAVPFSDLYERVGIDDTGNFNYHLGKLAGHFVRQTDAGYELAPPGFNVVSAVVAGSTTEDPTLPPGAVDVTCPHCESPVELSYTEGTTWIRCTECEGYWSTRPGEILGLELPPQGLRNRTRDGILDATIVYTLHRFEMMHDGVCPECGGTVDPALDACEDHDAAGLCDACGSRYLGIISLTCNSCKNTLRAPAWAPVQRHPALGAFYYEHGVEHVHTTWEAVDRAHQWDGELCSVDPPRLRFTVSCEGDELAVTVDETCTVADVDW